VQQHAEHEPVRRVPVQASHDAAEVPLVVRQVLDGGVRFADAGLEEDVQVEAARDDDPEQEVGDRAEVVERIVRFAERAIEQTLEAKEQKLARVLNRLQHRAGSFEFGRKIPATNPALRSPPGGGETCMREMLCARCTFRYDVDQKLQL